MFLNKKKFIVVFIPFNDTIIDELCLEGPGN